MELTKIDVALEYNAMDLEDVKAAFEVVSAHLDYATRAAKSKLDTFAEEDDIQYDVSWFVTRTLQNYIRA